MPNKTQIIIITDTKDNFKHLRFILQNTTTKKKLNKTNK